MSNIIHNQNNINGGIEMYNKFFDYEDSSFKVIRNIDKRKYFIKVKKEFIEVSEDVYKVCRSSYDKIKYTYKNEVARSILIYEDIDTATFLFPINQKSIVDQIYINDLVNQAISEINKLPFKDKLIAQCIFINQMTIQETSELLNIPATVFNHKKKIQKKLQKILRNME